MPNRTADIRNSTELKKIAMKVAAERCAREVMETVPLVMRFIRKEMRRQCAPFLSVPQLRTLIFLSRCPGASLSAVADHLGVTHPTASAIVNRLVQGGLVNRTEHPEERRCVVLALTRTGTQRLRYVREAACSLVAGVLADRSPAELNKVVEGITLLEKVFKKVVGQEGL